VTIAANHGPLARDYCVQAIDTREG
jgi:hypothetical protein